MKKSIIALAVAGVLTTPLAAQAAPKVYGKVHVSAGTHDDGTDDNFQAQSHASRVGVKGEQELGNGLKGTYKFEWQVDYEQDTDAGFDRRNMYVGLKGGFGEVRIGRHDTPLKMVQGKFDLFGDTAGDLKNAGDEDGENRKDNVIAYLGKSGALSYAIALIPSEDDGTAGGDGIADSTSVSLAYKEGPLYIGVAADSYDDTAAGIEENTITRLVGTYKFDGSQVGLLWQSGVEGARTSSDDKEDWLGVSFKTKMGGGNTFKAQYITVEDNQATPLEGTLTAIGIERKLGKKAKAYIQATSLEEEQGGTTTKELDTLTVGYVLKF